MTIAWRGRTGGYMERNHGHPYFDGKCWRCSRCNGLMERGICCTCFAAPAPVVPTPNPTPARALTRGVTRKPGARVAQSLQPLCKRCELPIYYTADGWNHRSATVNIRHRAVPFSQR